MMNPSIPTEKQAGLDEEPEIPVTSQAVVIDEFAETQQQEPPLTTAIPVGSSEPSVKYSSTMLTVGRTVEVIAPTNLLEGYQFYVDVGNNMSLRVQVVSEVSHLKLLFSVANLYFSHKSSFLLLPPLS